MTDADTRWSWALSRLVGLPLREHQLRAVAAANTPNLAGTGYADTTVVILAPRQIGKSTALLVLTLARGLHRVDYRAAYTAQTGHVVSERFGEPGGWFDLVTGSPLRARYRVRRSAGTERITATATRSFLRAFPPSPGKLRSSALDLVVLDECQEHSDDVGAALDADAGPTMTTRPRRQLIMAGTAGDRPGWWLDTVTAARTGTHGRIVEIGTWPDDADPADPTVWRAHHPGLRTGMTDEDFLRSQLDRLGPDAFAREYGNRWGAGGRAAIVRITPAAWLACATRDPLPTAPPPVLAVDAEDDRSLATIVAAAGGILEVVDQLPMPAAAARILDLARRHQVARVLVDDAGPALTVLDALRRAGCPHLSTTTAREYAAACADLADRVTAGTVAHRPHQALTDAVRHAQTRTVVDAWVWARRGVDAPTGPLVAATLAAWADTHRHADALV